MKTVLYLGLELPLRPLSGKVIHYPIIRILRRPSTDLSIASAFKNFGSYTDIILTSKVAVSLYDHYLQAFNISQEAAASKRYFSVGEATAKALSKLRLKAIYPTEECAEGLIDLLKTKNLSGSHFLWLHSSLSRKVVENFFLSHSISFCSCIAYETVPNTEQLIHAIDMETIDEIYFTSPSTVDAYLELFGKLPHNKVLTPIGPITAQRLQEAIRTMTDQGI